MPTFYFAYGSNLNREQMQTRCPGARPVMPYKLVGYQLMLRGVADIDKAPGQACLGAIYELSETHEKILDGYENYPHLYDKHYFETEVEGTPQKVMFYKLISPRYKKPREFYNETIAEGYANWGLDITFLEQAIERAQAIDLKSDQELL